MRGRFITELWPLFDGNDSSAIGCGKFERPLLPVVRAFRRRLRGGNPLVRGSAGHDHAWTLRSNQIFRPDVVLEAVARAATKHKELFDFVLQARRFVLEKIDS